MQINFNRNMNTLDRGLRAVIGLSLLILGPVTEFITTDELSGALMGIVGSLALVSAFFSYCILYDVTGFNTIKSSDQAEEKE